SYNGSLSQPSKLMTRVRLPSTALKTPEKNQEFFYFKLGFFLHKVFLTPDAEGFSWRALRQ
ncbi:hypothetical protein, partial [Treponema berlinense]|uniref:hypothetical protein n=1 Tax=Treponema berlinense TaxID=225004 RepID=UPI002353A0EE